MFHVDTAGYADTSEQTMCDALTKCVAFVDDPPGLPDPGGVTGKMFRLYVMLLFAP